MRCASILLSAFLAVSALAQPVVGPEVVSSPIANLDDYALAPQRGGFVVAWTAEGRLFAGHLDATLHITAPPLELPLFEEAATASLPAIASTGRSVLVAWHERKVGVGETAFMALLSADAQTLVKGPQMLNITKGGPLATTVNGKYVVYTGDLRYVFNENLETEDGVFISRDLGAALSDNGTVATVSESASGFFNCRQICFGRSCSGPPTPCSATSIVMFRFGAVTDSTSYTFNIPANSSSSDPLVTIPPAVGPNGDSYTGLVRLPNRTDVFTAEPFRQVTLPLIVSGQTALAGNGSDVLLVWTNPHLTGILIHADGTVSESFTIAPGGFQPRIVSINSNDFAVLYRTDFTQRSSIAGRIVYLQTPKRRGIR
jgi:hypothetical protein